MCVCLGQVSLHCFSSCTPGIIYCPISSCCMGVASRWNYNGKSMIKIFRGGGRGDDTFETPSPYEQLLPLPLPCFKNCFWKDLLMTPHHPTSSIFHRYPPPIHHPFFPHRNVDHTLRCSTAYVVYNMSVVSVMFLYLSRNDSGLHRNCTLHTKVIHVPSAFLRKL